MQPEVIDRRNGFQLEGKRAWWCGRTSNSVGGVSRSRVGSTPTSFRHYFRIVGVGNRAVPDIWVQGINASGSLDAIQYGKAIVELPRVWKTDDGSLFTLRQLAGSDIPALTAFIRGLSFAARYFRFGDADYDPGGGNALQACMLGPEQGLHLIVVTRQADGDIVIGSARYVTQPDKTRCEFAIVVADHWKHHGVGHQLMGALFDCAKSQGIHTMYGRILESNRDMIEFVRGFGFDVVDSPQGNWLQIATITL